MSEPVLTVSYPRVISTFGTRFWVSTDSASDYFLHPVFLRFMMLALGVYTLMDQSDDARVLVGWQMPVMWLATALTIIASFVLLGGWVLRLYRRGILRSVYTPFLLMPIIILAELTEQSMLQLMQVGDWKSLPNTLTDLTRDMLVIMLLDVMHALYVVPVHPLATLAPSGPKDTKPEEQKPEPSTQAREQKISTSIERAPPREDQAPESPMEMETRGEGEYLRIADRSFAIGDIQSVRTEDHYLNVVTRTGRSMLRAKLSDLDLLHDGRHGVQINRSQWVSFAAIDAVTDEENGQVTLHLVNGDSATVSRTRRLVFMQLFNSQRPRAD